MFPARVRARDRVNATSGRSMNRLRLLVLGLASSGVLALSAVPPALAAPAPDPPARGKAAFHNSPVPLCQSATSVCADPAVDPGNEYVGHDEPSVLFKSGVPGSGNN